MTLGEFSDRLKRRWERRAPRKYAQNLDNEAQKPRPKPRPISKSLKTPLRPESDWNWQTESPAGQGSSLLLTKLRADERRQIYQMVFGSRCIHVVQKYTRLAFLSCSVDGDATHLQAGCWGMENVDGTFLSRYWTQRNMRESRAMYTTDGGILPLLRICRLM